MKIAFDAKRLFNNHTGLGNYSRTLVGDLKKYFPENEYSLIAPNTKKSEYLDQFSSFNIIDPEPKISSYWRSFGIKSDINSVKPQIYHGLSNELPFSINGINALKIVTIHDLFYEKYPQDFTAFDRLIYKKKTEFACRNADHIVAISNATKNDIVNILGVDPKKITVIYQSCNQLYQAENLNLQTAFEDEIPTDYSLYVGTINKRKNLEGLIKAMGQIPRESLIPLVVVGKGKDSYLTYLKDLINQLKLKDYIRFIGPKSNDTLYNLYSKARFFVLPSHYEGFGIPIIESLFCNTPVISSKSSSLPESTGNCGLLIDPNNISELSSALQKMTESDDLLESFQRNIQNHLLKFSSRFTSGNINSLYKSLI